MQTSSCFCQHGSAFVILFQTLFSCPHLFVLSLIEPLRAQGIIPKQPSLSLIVTSRPGRAPGLELHVWSSEVGKETDVIQYFSHGSQRV